MCVRMGVSLCVHVIVFTHHMLLVTVTGACLQRVVERSQSGETNQPQDAMEHHVIFSEVLIKLFFVKKELQSSLKLETLTVTKLKLKLIYTAADMGKKETNVC